jgi:hypothetical protein
MTRGQHEARAKLWRKLLRRCRAAFKRGNPTAARLCCLVWTVYPAGTMGAARLIGEITDHLGQHPNVWSNSRTSYRSPRGHAARVKVLTTLVEKHEAAVQRIDARRRSK